MSAAMKKTSKWICVAGLAIASFAATGCGRPYGALTPNGFVELTDGGRTYDDDAHEYRASSADGVVLGVRAWKNEPKVDLDLAVRALENRIRYGEGYALLAKNKVVAGDGKTAGMRLDFGHDESDNPHLYSVAVFVTNDYVYLVEAGGKKPLVEHAKASIEWFMKNFKPS